MIISNYFDSALICDSGQCFRWRKFDDNRVRVVAFGRVLDILKTEIGYEVDCEESEWNDIWAPYFDMDTDYAHVESLIRNFKDNHLVEAFEKGFGIRILKQDLWEVIVSFLISQNNNISRIKNSIEALCKTAGKKIDGYDAEYAFPGPCDISKDFFCENNLGLGYRVPYLEEMFEYARNNPEWLSYLENLSYEQARAELLKRKGIGPKVADCICLFGLHHIEAFPIDTHVKQLLLKYYPDGFDHEYFKGVAGIVQQYLFYYEIA